MPNPVKSLGYIQCYSSCSPRPISNLAILSDTTVRRSTVDQEDLKPYWKSENMPPFSRRSSLFTSFSETLLTAERRLTGQWFLAMHLSPTFLNSRFTDKTSQLSGKQDSFRHILKSSASMYESSCSHSFESPLEYYQDQMPLTN